jgi:hypothetical protein
MNCKRGIIMDTLYDKTTEEVKALLEPEFAQRWPHANTTTVSVEVDNLIEKAADSIDKLTVNRLFDACIKQI